MEHFDLSGPVRDQEYAALRQSGTQACKAQIQLQLDPRRAAQYERMLLKLTRFCTGDRQTPKFADNDQHVANVMAAGGFWSLSERAVPGGGFVVCLPLTPPSCAPLSQNARRRSNEPQA